MASALIQATISCNRPNKGISPSPPPHRSETAWGVEIRQIIFHLRINWSQQYAIPTADLQFVDIQKNSVSQISSSVFMPVMKRQIQVAKYATYMVGREKEADM